LLGAKLELVISIIRIVSNSFVSQTNIFNVEIGQKKIEPIESWLKNKKFKVSYQIML